MRGNLYSELPSLSPHGKESSCPLTLALFQSTFLGLGTKGKKHRQGGGQAVKGRSALLLVAFLLACRAVIPFLKEKVMRSGFRRDLYGRDLFLIYFFIEV